LNRFAGFLTLGASWKVLESIFKHVEEDETTFEASIDIWIFDRISCYAEELF
jgi:hypothetical protein